ncbi:MAG: helix-turn-helix domain-containing protein [Thermoplasmata archaeon]|nr:helix-turn-helix domain-containing protein [Thermoplasmata archaeon]
MRSRLRERVAADVTLSDEPGKTMRKWREEIGISQYKLSREMNVSPSVISDYESGRRPSPGIKTVRRIVDALMRLDELSGGKFSKEYEGDENEGILDIKEFPVGIPADIFVKEIDGVSVAENVPPANNVNGYTILDSLKVITGMTSADYHKIYGWSSQRALIFVGVKFGRSPMVAIRAHPLRPAMVVYVRPERVDPLAVKLAELEKVCLVRTELEVPKLVERLSRL